MNINIVHKDGYKDRLSEIFQKNLSEGLGLVKKFRGKELFSNKLKVVNLILHQIKKYISLAIVIWESLMFNLKDRIVKSNYQFITSTYGGCLFYPGFNWLLLKQKRLKIVMIIIFKNKRNFI